jgi:3-phenylpropionate/cinnamic acid dioxygenase small subunit/catechol 2,3-dioxygenase-like lactoylglutathione lyase family enzyme
MQTERQQFTAIVPSKFAHVVYKTHKFEQMVDWYLKVFSARIQHRDDRLAFLTYDEEHHRFAFVNLGPAIEERPRREDDAGVHHVAYTWKNLGELVQTYKRLKALGIAPVQPIRHGLTLSMYYHDPDRNMLEFQIDLMDPESANAFMAGSAFSANPVGERFNPDELAARFDAGEPADDIIFRTDQPERNGQAYCSTRSNSSSRGHAISLGATKISPELQLEIEQYYYNEAEMLDDHRYGEWLDLFSYDAHYWMPTRANRLLRDHDKEVSLAGDFALFDDDKKSLSWRVRQMESATHWAENPRSRTRHLVTNVRITPIKSECEYEVKSNFICYRNRLQDEVDIWAGERLDLLRRDQEQELLIARRKILLDQSVVLSKNLSVFF